MENIDRFSRFEFWWREIGIFLTKGPLVDWGVKEF